MAERPRAAPWDPTTALEALAASGSALWEWTPSDDRLRFTGATRALGLGPLAPECGAAAFLALVQPSDRAFAEQLVSAGEEGDPVQLRFRMNGGQACAWKGVWLEDGVRAAGLVVPDNAFAAVEGDGLTGLLDRKRFTEAVRRALQDTGGFELVVADLDRLRRLNEALGHERADMVLQALASRLAAAFPKSALPARIGEDEFAILTPDGVTKPVERLRAALEQPLRIAGFDIYPTLAIGAVRVEGGREAPDAAELLRRAELAVEQAKQAGRGGGAAYAGALESDSLSRLALESDLRGAFVRGEIVPFYQPIVNLETGAVAGFEALARWRHPKRGLVPPDEFLGLAQEMGLMNDLGLLMMTACARQLAEWRRRWPNSGSLFCSVNLSTGEVERPGLMEDVARIIRDTGLPRGALKLEVTESDVMRDPDKAAEILASLKAAGASLALDDFGTGFSSLTYLARLPFDTLKIDRYFVRTMTSDEGSSKIVRSVVTLGRDLSLEVVAEGVENAPLARRLLSVGCHYGQGFGYAPALEPTAAEVYLTESLLDGAAPLKQRG